jgi:hypothetical protein
MCGVCLSRFLASTSGSVRFGSSIIPSPLSSLGQCLVILLNRDRERERESLLSDVSFLAQPWASVHAKDARNRGISIGAGLEARLALCGLESLTPMGRRFWVWKAPTLETVTSRIAVEKYCSPVQGYSTKLHSDSGCL